MVSRIEKIKFALKRGLGEEEIMLCFLVRKRVKMNFFIKFKIKKIIVNLYSF